MKIKRVLFAAVAAAGALTAQTSIAPVALACNNVGYQGKQFFQLVNNSAHKCIGISGGQMSLGTIAVQWTCRSSAASPDQWWSWTGQGQLVNRKDPAKCLGVDSGYKTQGAHLVIWTCNGYSTSPDQYWVAQSGNGGNKIVNDHSGLVIAVYGGAVSDNASIVQWNYSGSADQNWNYNYCDL